MGDSAKPWTLEAGAGLPFPGALIGDQRRRYKVIAAPLRNSGGPNYWQPIDDGTQHRPTNIDSVSTTSGDGGLITVNYASLNALRVVTACVVADETLAAAGYDVGASVGTAFTNLTLTRSGSFGDHFTWNGSAFVPTDSPSPFGTPSWAGGVLTLPHSDVGTGATYNGAVTGRGGFYVPQIKAATGSINRTHIDIEFYDFAGTKVSVGDANMRVFVQRGCRGIVDPQTIDTTLLPFSNLWFYAMVEV